MRHIAISEDIDTTGRRLPFFLALEEWVARRLPAGNYFFSWQVNPTVICGRNQEIDKEVNLAYCRANGIDVVRRRSGGGCVFADRQNFMFSFITDSNDHVAEVFSRYTAMIADALRKLGFDAIASGRNDITIGEKKVSGNAFYHLPGRSIAHGTMLYDFDTACLANALTPSKAKLESKGVKSVPMRVTCLKNEGITLTPVEFERFMIESITDGEPYVLTAEDVAEVEKIEQGYYDPAFMRISANKTSETAKGKRHVSNNSIIKGLGEFCVEFDIDPAGSHISNVSISGDFFMHGDVDEAICRRLEGAECTADALMHILQGIKVSEIIPSLTPEALSRMFIQNN